MATQNSQSTAFLSTGVDGLDNVLNGGLTRDRLYLVEGDPGAGKTTMAIQFLIEGARLGEPVLYITLSENEVELRSIAASHGWSMDGIVIHEAIPNENILDPKEQYTLFHPSEVEIGGTMHEILATIERVRPTRVVLDSLSELQLLAGNALHYRRQVLAYKQFLAKRSCTALLLDNRSASDMDLQVRSIAHGVISLDQRTMEYGTEQRRIRVTKYRGIAFRGGLHDYTVTTGGLRVFPRLVASDTRNQRVPEQFRSGLPELDALLGGGLETGSSTLFAGPPGAGKSTLASLFVSAALKSNLRAAMFLFEESASNLLNRSEALNMDLGGALATGQLLLKQVDPAEMSPGEFSHAVCAAADGGAKVIVIDSLNGYLNAMPDARFLTTHLHELLTYLGQRGVVTILVAVQQGMIGGQITTAFDASYLSDNVLLLRYFESAGEVRQAVSVFKKRGSAHERTIREFSITPKGVQVGPVLRQFKGILTGVPTTDESSVSGRA